LVNNRKGINGMKVGHCNNLSRIQIYNQHPIEYQRFYSKIAGILNRSFHHRSANFIELDQRSL